MRELWNKWKELAEKIGNFQANLIFSLLFYVLVTPVGFVANMLSDFLLLKGNPLWNTMIDNASTKAKIKEQ